MRKIRIADIKAAASKRPEGYVEDIISRGRIEGDVLVMVEDEYQQVMEKYGTRHHGDVSELAARRFAICKACPESTDGGFGCRLFHQCCFGRWRTNPANQCPADPPRWRAANLP